METVDLKLPSELLKAANLDEQSLSEDAARLLALELYREGRVSLGRAADLCHTSVGAFMDFAARHGVPSFRPDPDDMKPESPLSSIAPEERQKNAEDNDFCPIEIPGEPLSATILRDRR